MKASIGLTFFCIILFASSSTNNDASCQFTIDSILFDFCPFSANSTYTTLSTIFYGNLLLSLGLPTVPSCNGDGTVFAVLQNGPDCFDVAVESPNITLLDSSNPNFGGLSVTFPIAQSESDDQSFQLNIDLSCSPYDTASGFDGAGILVPMISSESNLTTFSLTGVSLNACPKHIPCPPTVFEDYTDMEVSYSLCPFNSTLFNVSDSIGGYITFTLGSQNQLPNCPGTTGQVSANYYTPSGECYPLGYDPGYSYYETDVLVNNTWTTPQGVTVGYGSYAIPNPNAPYDSLVTTLTVNMVCDSTETGLSSTKFTVDTVIKDNSDQNEDGSDTQGSATFTVSGTSYYACPGAQSYLN